MYSILWDVGATYLMTNGEGPSLSTKIISFQNLKNYMKTGKDEKKIEDVIENVELKYVTSFETTLVRNFFIEESELIILNRDRQIQRIARI